MSAIYENIRLLTSATNRGADYWRAMDTFAYNFGWRPSDYVDDPFLSEYVNAHLVVEHGLETSAVITFIREPYRFSSLGTSERQKLFSVSYNNLVDWHIQVQSDEVLFVYNRLDVPEVVASQRINSSEYDYLRSANFNKITGRAPGANLPALDDALIKTVSLWKRMLSAEMGYTISNESISALLNAIFFVRAVEDHRWHREAGAGTGGARPRMLIDHMLRDEGPVTAAVALREALQRYIPQQIPEYLIDFQRIAEFDGLAESTVQSLFMDFYKNRYAGYYEYDFSLMSKHALSRIYESYISVLRIEDSPQASLFPELPYEDKDRAFGRVYTPQYIARFFGRFVMNREPAVRFRRMSSLDPACGSGIFLRTLLELQCAPQQGAFDSAVISTAFASTAGADVDGNAVQATKLSLALLHLVLTDSLPEEVDVDVAEAIEHFGLNEAARESRDLVVANPPFVPLDIQSPEMRQRILEYMGEHAIGRTDMYHPFIKIALQVLRPGGYGMFVLPQSFLTGKSSGKLRALLAQDAVIRCLVDLSAVRVFGDLGSYVILLIFQKRGPLVSAEEPAVVVKCDDFAGAALQDAADDRTVETPFYSVYKVSQSTFAKSEWVTLPPRESGVRRRLETLPTLSEYVDVRQGIVTGADEVFILPEGVVPVEERSVFLPLLPDRAMRQFTVPERTGQLVFNPYLDHTKLTAAQLQSDFPWTWAHFEENRERLAERGSLQRYGKEWWEPLWPRSPDLWGRPKILTPHLVFTPKFSLDIDGRYGVTRASMLIPKQQSDDGFSRFILAVANSSIFFWFLSTISPSYRGGYLKLEGKALKRVPVPRIEDIDLTSMRNIIDRVDRLMSDREHVGVYNELDELISQAYGLTELERRQLFGDG
jgi:hypothetical protein